MGFQGRFLYGAVAVIIIAIFTSSACATRLYSYTEDFDLAIPPQENGKGWMTDAAIFVWVNWEIIDLDVTINLTHSSICDLQIYLRSPAGTRISLNHYDIDDFVPFEKNFLDTTFDDEAQVAIEDGQGPFTGRFRPKSPGSLSVFDGENAYGLWRIQVYDAVYEASGTFHNAQLDFVINPEPSTVAFLIMGIFWRKLRWQRKVKR